MVKKLMVNSNGELGFHGGELKIEVKF